MLVLVAGHAGNDRHSGEMFGGPFDLLRSRPIAERKAGEDGRLQMLDRVEQPPGIGHFRQRPVEIAGGGDSPPELAPAMARFEDRKSTRLNSSHGYISYAVFCLKKKKTTTKKT